MDKGKKSATGKTRKPHSSRNYSLGNGLYKFGKSVMYHKTGRWAIKNKTATPKKVAPSTRTITTKAGKNITLPPKSPNHYPTYDSPKLVIKKKTTHKIQKLKSSIKPGSVLIILAGKDAGKRVVFLKQLASGTLLVSGPLKVNGVPLRRVNQAYVIGTSTTVDISKVKVDDKVNDDFFKKTVEKKKKSEKEFFNDDKKVEKKAANPEKVALQKAVDDALLAEIKKVEGLKKYLASRFFLPKGVAPHTLKF